MGTHTGRRRVIRTGQGFSRVIRTGRLWTAAVEHDDMTGRGGEIKSQTALTCVDSR